MINSEEINIAKESDLTGVCGICHLEFRIIGSTGLLRKHGTGSKLQNQKCPGSYSAPIIHPIVRRSISLTEPLPNWVNSISIGKNNTPSIDKNNTPSIDNASNCMSLNYINELFKNSNFSKPITYIPHAARTACRNLLVTLMRAVIEDPANEKSWILLLSFPHFVLKKANRGGRKTNLTKVIKQRLVKFNFLEPIQNEVIHMANSANIKKTVGTLSTAVSNKIECGNLRAAVRLISQDEGIAVINTETANNLRLIHPSRISKETTHLVRNALSLQVTQNQILKAVRAFPKGSSAGPDGLSPQHLLDLISGTEDCSNYLETLTQFINLLLSGECPQIISRLLCGGRLIALKKDNGKLRPIAIGCTYRRVAAKCANIFACDRLKQLFGSLQVGVGCKSGAEAAVHATRFALSEMGDDSCLVKLDMVNAFNCINRNDILSSVYKNLPDIFNFVKMCYDDSTALWFNGEIIESSEGVQQGDPLGCLLFGLTIHPALQNLKSSYKIGYIDDITLIDKISTVEIDIINFEYQLKKIGLSLNHSKCELVSSGQIRQGSVLSKFRKIDHINCELLGAPLFAGDRLKVVLQNKISDLARLGKRLNEISAHDSLLILKNVLSLPRLNYLLRCSPCYNQPLLNSFDETLRDITSSALNLEICKVSWNQATLPVKMGGIGLRLTSDLAPSAFLASYYAALDLSTRIYPSVVEEPLHAEAFAVWLSINPILLYPKDPTRQKSWDEPGLRDKRDNIFKSLTIPEDRARFLALQSPKSGAWLEAWPISSCGLRLTDNEVRVSVGFRLGANICHPHSCKLCGASVDAKGTHALSCRKSAGRHVRHSMLNDIVHRALLKINVPSLREMIIGPEDNNRVDGCTLIPWQQGKLMAWDVTVADTLAASHIKDTSIKAGAAALKAAAVKYLKYNNLPVNYEFFPICFETFGPIHEVGLNILNAIGDKIATIKKDKREISFLFQRISIAIQKGNSISFKGSIDGFIESDHFI